MTSDFSPKTILRVDISLNGKDVHLLSPSPFGVGWKLGSTWRIEDFFYLFLTQILVFIHFFFRNNIILQCCKFSTIRIQIIIDVPDSENSFIRCKIQNDVINIFNCKPITAFSIHVRIV